MLINIWGLRQRKHKKAQAAENHGKGIRVVTERVIMGWNTIIYDLDGTLLNSLDDIRDSANYTMRQMGVSEKSKDEIKMAVGNGVKNLLTCCLPEERKDEKTLEQALQIFREHYFIHSQDKTAPYNGACAHLQCLQEQGLKMAVVSNKPDEAAQGVVRHFFGDWISYVSGERKGMRRKPAPDLIREAMRTLNSDGAGAVYVGDTEVDVLTARNAGLPVILVSWGYRSRETLEPLQADYLVDSFEELTSLILAQSAGELPNGRSNKDEFK